MSKADVNDPPNPSEIVVAVEGFGDDPTGGFGSLAAAVEYAKRRAANITAHVAEGGYRYFPAFGGIAVVVRNRWGAKPREFLRIVCKDY